MDSTRKVGAIAGDRQQQSEFWQEQGRSLCAAERFAEAVAAFDQALSLNAGNCKAWNNRGNALSGLKQHAVALASYDRAIALQPDYHQAWFNRGLLLAEMMAYGNALASYDRAIAIHADPCYLHARADIWLKQKLFA